MYDINKLRKEFENNSKKLELLNELHIQICRSHYSNQIPITLNEKRNKKYGNKMKQEIVSRLGYKILNPNPTFTFVIQKI